MRSRLRWFGLPEAALVAVFVLAWVLLARQGMRNHVLQPDEALPVLGSRYINAHFPSGLFSAGASGRGLERGIGYAFALVQWLIASTPAVLKSMHILLAGATAAVAPVAWGWARELGLARWPAAGVGACAVALPWSTFGITFLNAGPAQTLTVLALYACWRALMRPGVARDVVALLALLALGLVRVGNLTVAASVPAALVAVALAGRRPGVSRLRAIWGELRAHPVWLAVGAAAAVVLAVGGGHRVVGHYPIRSPLGQSVKTELRIALAQLGAGLALFPLAVGGAWALRMVVRPRRRETAGLAALLVASFLMLVYAAATQGPEERYVAAIGPVVVVAFACALARREAGIVTTVLGAVVVGREVVLHAFPLVGLPFGALGSPATTFFQRVAVGKASLHLPVGAGHPATSLAILAGAGAVALAFVGRRGPWRALVPALGLLALYGGAGAIYTAKKFIDGAGYPGLSYATQAWIDGKVGSGADVGIVQDPNATAIFREVRLFNRSTGLRPDIDLSQFADLGTGAVRPGLPRYLALTPVLRPLGLEERQIAVATYLPEPVVLSELQQPPRLAYAQQPGAGGATVVRFFAHPAARCAVIGFRAPQGAVGGRRWVLTIGGRRVTGTLAGVTPTAQLVPLPVGRTVDARLRVARGGELTDLGVAPCP